MTFRPIYFLSVVTLIFASGCELIKMRNEEIDNSREPVARVQSAVLYKDDLAGISPPTATKEDSIARIEAYVDSWIRKQLVISQAQKQINIDEAALERKILDYRYSLIAYEYQTFYIKNNLDTAVSSTEIQEYYQKNLDNFILKQNIIRATFLKVPKNAPNTKRIRDWIFSKSDEARNELKSYCLSFSAAYHISDSTWMFFDELVRNSPLWEIPNKVQFLKMNPYYETEDENFLYYLKVDEYRISDNVSPLEFVRDEIKNIILNKRKVELAKKLEDEVYNDALDRKEFEIFSR